jgi:hypothetical protein
MHNPTGHDEPLENARSLVGWAKSPAVLVNGGLGASAILPTRIERVRALAHPTVCALVLAVFLDIAPAPAQSASTGEARPWLDPTLLSAAKSERSLIVTEHRPWRSAVNIGALRDST